MKKAWVGLGVWVLLSFAAGATALEEVLEKPGIFSQMCMLMPPKPKGALPLFGYRRDWAMARISVENFRRLRSERPKVVAEAGRLLDSAEGDQLELCLMVLLDLNGVEAMPSLLRLEKRLHAKPVEGTEGGYSPHVQVLSVLTALLRNEKVKGVERLQAHYDESTRAQIVQLAQRFVSSGAKPRAAAAMAAEPIAR